MFPFAIGICYRRSVVREMAPRKTMIVSRSYGSSVSTLEPFTKPAIPVRRHTIKVNPESRTSRSTLQDLCRCQVRGTQPRHPVMPHEMHDWWRFQVFWWKRSRVLSIWWSWYIAMVECVPSAQQTRERVVARERIMSACTALCCQVMWILLRQSIKVVQELQAPKA
jgi:hypothetical protein